MLKFNMLLMALSQVREAPTTVTQLVKTTVCPKTSVPWLTKDFYSPTCILSCKEVCGAKHSKRSPKCGKIHQVIWTAFSHFSSCLLRLLPLDFLLSCPLPRATVAKANCPLISCTVRQQTLRTPSLSPPSRSTSCLDAYFHISYKRVAGNAILNI